MGICSYAQSVSLQGKVIDKSGLPVIGATVKIKDTNKGATAGADGTFTLSYEGTATLVATAIGFNPAEVTVSNQSSITITMSENQEELSEVVVTALGVKREKRVLTYSAQEVQGATLVEAKEPNIVNALSGKVPGVQITSASGTPGSSSRIVIRGATSFFGNNQALIVVDGVPINNDETGNLTMGPGTNRLADIDPGIIENISVLKGAAATALYGSAGARGVLMITTKSGRGNVDKKPVVTVSQDISFETPWFPEVQEKYAQGERGIYYNGEDQKTSSSWGPLMDTLMIDGQKAKKYNQLKDFFRTGVTSNSTISVTGGNGSSDYLMSYSYLNQTGTVPETDYKRHALFAKYNTKILKNLNSVFQLNYSSSNNNRQPEGYTLESPIWTIYTAPISWNPQPYLNPDGTQRVFRYSRNNPYWALDNIHNGARVNRFIPVITLSYNPLSWLTITERMGADIYTEQDKYTEAIGSVSNPTGKIIEQNINFRQFNHDFMINANKTWGDFNVNLLLGNNVFSTYSQYQRATGTGLSVAGFDNIGQASNISYSENHYQSRKVGFYAQSNIDYKRTLVLSLTGRFDQSSVLAEDKNSYPYGSVAGGFIFSELLSPSLSNVLSFGKVRVSYAVVGNDGVEPYQLNTPFQKPDGLPGIGAITFPYQGQSGYLLSQTLGNVNLRNEQLNEFEVGLETSLFGNRIALEASYFDRKTRNGIIPGVAIAPSTGYTGTTVNSAEMSNKGIEVLLNAKPVVGKHFSWDFSFNFSHIRNEVLAIYGDMEQLGNGFTSIVVGQPYGVIMGSSFKRNEQGQLMIDEAGLPFSDGSVNNIGNITPDWMAGLTNTLRYNQLALSFQFDMKKGGDIQNNVDGYGYFYGTPKVTENREDRVVEGISVVDGKENTISVSGQDYYRRLNAVTEAVIQDGTYIKLRTVSLSYNFGKALLPRSFLKSASFVVTGRNLWIYSPHFTGGDPETSPFGSGNGSQGIYSFSTPTSRSINFSLKASF
ncbi:SusC/RagA family TonB-linked outer membrane protein [Chitinophaga japonensis]|uniref:SusC/RagA family TonB-linked outer membrane protein n=1 Tax=Chitinophaga japonensis TaxID=104662 RepID=UPI001FCECE7D|nr:SusC/RagA family TonB-linked outer membrane protein [Chitinophaga japonensis]